MKEYMFTLILASDRAEEQVDHLCGTCEGAVLSGVTSGIPYLDCTIESESLERAILHVRNEVAAMNLRVVRVEMDPEALVV